MFNSLNIFNHKYGHYIFFYKLLVAIYFSQKKNLY